MNITRTTPIPFGYHKGIKLRDLPDKYLVWITTNLRNTDFHNWVLAAEKEIKDRQAEGGSGGSLEEQANRLLNKAGYGHLAEPEKRKYQPRGRR